MAEAKAGTFDTEVRRFDMPAHFHLRDHVHPGWHLLAVTAGAVAERTASAIQPMARGSLRLSPPGATHDLLFGPAGASCLMVAIPPRWMPRRWLMSGAGLESFFVADAALFQSVLEIDLDGATFEAAIRREIGLRRVIAGMAQLRECGSLSAPPGWLAALTDSLETAGDSPRIADIAGALGLRREHIARVFHSFTGYSPSQYRITIRLLRAAQALSRRRTDIRVTSDDSGFSNQSHFTNQCRARLGVQPSTLRLAPGLAGTKRPRWEVLGGTGNLAGPASAVPRSEG